MKRAVVIIGGGPAGSAAAMFLKKHGIESTIVERMKFPRYHIGESMTGECGQSVRRLGLDAEMDRAGYPIKRAASIYGNNSYKWSLPIAARDEDWNLRLGSTWQVRRAEFDKMLLDTAIARGTDFINAEAAAPIVDDAGAVRGVTIREPAGRTFDIETEMLLDCSGQATFLANSGVTGPKYSGNYDRQVAIFSQVANTIRDPECPDDTLLFYKRKYHWSWFIPLDDEVVSVGVVAPLAYFKDQKESTRDYLRREMRELNPEFSRRIPDTTLVEGVRSIPNYSFQVRRFAGKGFICVGDAHRFLDPIYSFGMCVSLHEAEAAAVATRDWLDGKGRDDEDPFIDYRRERERGIDVAEDLMDAFWEYPFPFALLVRTHTDEMIDIFAGRLWQRQPNTALTKMRAMLQRERTYGAHDEFSVPIGSRYHPERVGIWVAEPRVGIDTLGELPTE
jgi:flavin-dependent dehydrogenase